MRVLKMWTWIALLLAIVGGCDTPSDAPPREKAAEPGAPSPAPLEKVTLLLNWFPEAEHGGFIAAQAHGDYAEQGLEVAIVPGGPNAPVMTRVAHQARTFAVAGGDEFLQGAAVGVPAIAVMAAAQRSPMCIMVHASSGITRLKDLHNLTLAAESAYPHVQFLKRHAKLEGVTIVPYAGNVAEFLVRKDYAQQAYVTSEPFQARQKGADPRCLLFSELGYNPYASVLVTSRALVAQHPALVARMVAASVKGWQRYVRDPTLTNTHIRTLNPELDEEVLALGAAAYGRLVLADGTPPEKIGRMSLERWQTSIRQLEAVGAIPRGSVTAKDVVTTQFLPRSVSGR